MLKKKLTPVIAVIVVVALVSIAITYLTKTSDTVIVGAIGTNPVENYIPIIKYNDGYYSELAIQTTSTITATGAITSSAGLSGTTGSFSGLVTLNAGQLRSYTNSTSTTATTYTLVVGDVLNYDTVLLMPNTGTLALTFFASSTATTLVPSAGDVQETCFFNATTTSGINITFATATGINLQTVATTTTSGATGMLAIPPQGYGCFKFLRQPATATAFDIGALYTPYRDAE